MASLLVLGGEGQVGRELLRLDWPHHHVVSPTRSELDLQDAYAVSRFVGQGGWAAVINAAAYTAVDRAESDVLAAWQVNALAPAALGQATAQLGIPVVHVSTDYVFDGTSNRSYREDDPVAPLNVYGAGKEAGEQAIRTTNVRHLILRTAWLFSPHRSNFVRTMLRLASERAEIRVVDDQIGSPTSAADLAKVIQLMMRCNLDEDAPLGTYHVANAGEASWCGLAREIMLQSELRGGPVARVEAIFSADYPTPARRPRSSRLDCTKLARDYGISMRQFDTALSDVMDELVGSARGAA